MHDSFIMYPIPCYNSYFLIDIETIKNAIMVVCEYTTVRKLIYKSKTNNLVSTLTIINIIPNNCGMVYVSCLTYTFTPPNLTDEHGDPLNDPFVRANMFNDHFCHVYKSVDTNSTNKHTELQVL